MHLNLVLVNLTTSANTLPIDSSTLTGIIAASGELLQTFAIETGDTPTVAMRIASDPNDRKPGEIACNFRDNIPEAPGALAFHAVTNGVPDIELGVGLFQALTSGSESVSVGFTHELLEMLGDLGANGWKDNGLGKLDAEEECDWVQNTCFTASNSVDVTNFLLPVFFIPGADGPWDHMGAMKNRQDVSNGYGIQASSPTSSSQVGGLLARRGWLVRPAMVGSLTDAQKKRKSHPYSRTRRRGLIL